MNVKSALYGMQTVLPHFRSRGRGHIINVSSMLGRVPYVPQRSAYNAAKSALNALTANLRMELRASCPAIHVSTVSPGVVATDFGLNALGGGLDSRKFPGAQPVEEVAEVIVGVIEKPRADVYTRAGAQQQVVSYYAAEDMGGFEAQLPLGAGPPGVHSIDERDLARPPPMARSKTLPVHPAREALEQAPVAVDDGRPGGVNRAPPPPRPPACRSTSARPNSALSSFTIRQALV